MAEATLLKMAAGGVCDHLGGGFHRYSVDELWHVPHFATARAAAARAALSGTALPPWRSGAARAVARAAL